MKTKYIVIGGVAAGMSAASRIRKTDPNGEITVFEKGAYISYSACSMPYFINDYNSDFNDLIVLSPDKAKLERNINVKTNCEVVKIDKTKKTITYINLISKKENNIGFDRLIIATGAKVLTPDINGIERENVFVLRNLSDGIKIKKYLSENETKNIGIIGAGLIGLEMCETFIKLGKNVTLVEIGNSPVKNFNDKIVEKIKEKLKENNIKLLLNHKVERLEKENMLLKNQKIPVDMVFLATGIEPNTNLAVETGIELGIKNSISVDSRMETSVSGIFAAGDCAESINSIVNKKVYVPLGTVANKQGRVAGINAAKGFARFGGVLGSFEFKMFDLQVAKTGLSAIEANMFGIDSEEVCITAPSAAHGYKERFPIEIVMTADKKTRRLLGVQMAGKSGVAHRINIVAASLYKETTVDEFSNMDFAYAPPFSPVWDPLLVAANVLKSKL